MASSIYFEAVSDSPILGHKQEKKRRAQLKIEIDEPVLGVKLQTISVGPLSVTLSVRHTYGPLAEGQTTLLWRLPSI